MNFTDIVTRVKMDPKEYTLYDFTYMKLRAFKTKLR